MSSTDVGGQTTGHTETGLGVDMNLEVVTARFARLGGTFHHPPINTLTATTCLMAPRCDKTRRHEPRRILRPQAEPVNVDVPRPPRPRRRLTQPERRLLSLAGR
jgi:hypothetical protein